MITILGKTFYWPGERLLLTRCDAQERHLSDQAFALATLMTEIAALKEALWVVRGSGYLKPSPTDFVVPLHEVISCREVRSWEFGRRFEVDAIVVWHPSGPVDMNALMNGANVSFSGISWKLARFTQIEDDSRLFGLRGAFVGSARQQKIELSLVAMGDPNSRKPSEEQA